VEQRSNEAVRAAENDKDQAKQAWKSDMQELGSESDAAATAFEQLKKSKARLDADLQGHKDLRYEKDIKAKAADIERIEGLQMSNEEMPQPANVETSEENPRAPGENDVPPVLGESQHDIPSALQAAEEEAENAVNNKGCNTATGQGCGGPPKPPQAADMNPMPEPAANDPMDNSAGPPMDPTMDRAPMDPAMDPAMNRAPMDPPSMPTEAANEQQDEVVADLSAISQDAQGLEKYQASASAEMEKVRKWLK